MSQENVEIVRRFYRAWADDDLPGPEDFMDPEIEYINPTGAAEPGTGAGGRNSVPRSGGPWKGGRPGKRSRSSSRLLRIKLR